MGWYHDEVTGAIMRYFTREEAEKLLPAISVLLRKIQVARQSLRALEEEQIELKIRAMGNGHQQYGRIIEVQKEMAASLQELRVAARELRDFGCELKDPDKGLVDFLSLRDGQEIYLCWYLGEERIAFWHDLHTGFAGRQPLDE
jgi:hypothetical protein